MVKFHVSIRKPFGDITLTGSDEQEILHNLKRLESLAHDVEKEISLEVNLSEEIIEKITSCNYAEKLLILLNFSPRPLSREECRKNSQQLLIPEGWWNGSNFNRDLKKQEKKGNVKIAKNNVVGVYELTNVGRKYVNDVLLK